MVTIVVTESFEKEVKKIRDKTMQERVKKQIEKIMKTPDTGKLLTHSLKGERTIRIPPYRIVYAFQGETITLLRFRHRKEVYNS